MKSWNVQHSTAPTTTNHNEDTNTTEETSVHQQQPGRLPGSRKSAHMLCLLLVSWFIGSSPTAVYLPVSGLHAYSIRWHLACVQPGTSNQHTP